MKGLNEIFRGKVSVIPALEEGEKEGDVSEKIINKIKGGGLKNKSLEMHEKLFGNMETKNKLFSGGFGNINFDKKMEMFGVKKTNNNLSKITGNVSSLSLPKFTAENKLHSLIGGSNINGFTQYFKHTGVKFNTNSENVLWNKLKSNTMLQHDYDSHDGIIQGIKNVGRRIVGKQPVYEDNPLSDDTGETIVEQDLRAVGEGAKSVGGKLWGGVKTVASAPVKGVKKAQTLGFLPTVADIGASVAERREQNKINKRAKRGFALEEQKRTVMARRIVYDPKTGKAKEVIEEPKEISTGKSELVMLEGARTALESRRTKNVEFQDLLRRKEAGLPLYEPSKVSGGKNIVKVIGPKYKKGFRDIDIGNQTEVHDSFGGNYGLLRDGQQEHQPQSTTSRILNELRMSSPVSERGIISSTRGAYMLPGRAENIQQAIGQPGGSWAQIKQATELPQNMQGLGGVDKIRWMIASPAQKQEMLEQMQSQAQSQAQIQVQQMQQPQETYNQEENIEQRQPRVYSQYSKKPVTYVRGPYRK